MLGTSDQCIATHASDLAVALAALDATVHVTGLHGNRSIALRDFYRLPGSTPQIETTLEPGELIVAVSAPILAYAARSTYVKVRDRAQYDFALASAAVASTCRAARSARRASRSAASRRYPGDPAKPNEHCAARPQRARPSSEPQPPRWPARAATAATTSRFRWRSARSCARSRSPRG